MPFFSTQKCFARYVAKSLTLILSQWTGEDGVPEDAITNGNGDMPCQFLARNTIPTLKNMTTMEDL